MNNCHNGKICPKCFYLNGLTNNFCNNCRHKIVTCIKCNVNYANDGFKMCQSCYVNHANNMIGKCKQCKTNNTNNGHSMCQQCYKNTKDCGHRICRLLQQSNCNNAAFVLPLLDYRNNGVCAWLGLENGGQYKNQCNLIGGKGDNNDRVNGHICWINIAIREMDEEIKFKLDKIDEFCPFIIHNNTPILLVRLKNGTSRASSQNQINMDNSNNNLPSHLKEMSYIACVSIKNCRHVDKTQLPISNFAYGVIKKISSDDLRKLGF